MGDPCFCLVGIVWLAGYVCGNRDRNYLAVDVALGIRLHPDKRSGVSYILGVCRGTTGLLERSLVKRRGRS